MLVINKNYNFDFSKVLQIKKCFQIMLQFNFFLSQIYDLFFSRFFKQKNGVNKVVNVIQRIINKVPTLCPSLIKISSVYTLYIL